jgi:hypothetical protein
MGMTISKIIASLPKSNALSWNKILTTFFQKYIRVMAFDFLKAFIEILNFSQMLNNLVKKMIIWSQKRW